MDRKKKEVSKYGEDTNTSDYGLSLQKMNIGPKKKLLVFGLNGVLIYRVFFLNKANIPKSRTHEDYYAGHLVYRRPYFKEFMKFCFERFEVGIWSSSKEVNIEAVSALVLKEFRKKPLFAWDQKYCTDSGFTIEENNGKKQIVFKELRKLWEHTDPWTKGQFSSSNTLLIDDEPYTALLNPPNTAIFPQPYNVDDVNEKALNWNGELRRFLEGLVYANDVPMYVKEHPFGQPAITPSHPDWNHYSEIIQQFQVGSVAEEKKI